MADMTKPVETSSPHLSRSIPVVNAANILTTIRVALVPVFAVLLVMSHQRNRWLLLAAAVVFGVAAITDLYDGKLARSRNQITPFGQIADPIADKALVGTALVTLSLTSDLSWWISGIILGRELLITLLRLWVVKKQVIPASRGGKLKTALFVLAVPCYLWAGPPWWHDMSLWIMISAAAVTVVTGVDYVIQVIKVRQS